MVVLSSMTCSWPRRHCHSSLFSLAAFTATSWCWFVVVAGVKEFFEQSETRQQQLPCNAPTWKPSGRNKESIRCYTFSFLLTMINGVNRYSPPPFPYKKLSLIKSWRMCRRVRYSLCVCVCVCVCVQSLHAAKGVYTCTDKALVWGGTGKNLITIDCACASDHPIYKSG